MAASVEKLSVDEAKLRLRSWRENNVRKSEEVIEVWDTILQGSINKLGDEKFLVYEQVCIAALDTGRISVAQKCLQALNAAFPDSTRVKKLKGMRLEAQEKYDEALAVYESILKKDETNSIARKRKIAILKAQNKTAEAIEELNKYLKKFMADYEAWMELADLYIRCQDYGKAAFCLEELIMSSPYNHLYHQRFAEVKYTQGGMDNMEIARSYFAQAVALNPDNMRALHGMLLAASTVAASPKCNAKKKKEHQDYAEWAAKQISDRYDQAAATAGPSRHPRMSPPPGKKLMNGSKSSPADGRSSPADDRSSPAGVSPDLSDAELGVRIATDALAQLQLTSTTPTL